MEKFQYWTSQIFAMMVYNPEWWITIYSGPFSGAMTVILG